jgi:hypothetical protein
MANSLNERIAKALEQDDQHIPLWERCGAACGDDAPTVLLSRAELIEWIEESKRPMMDPGEQELLLNALRSLRAAVGDLYCSIDSSSCARTAADVARDDIDALEAYWSRTRSANGENPEPSPAAQKSGNV